MKRNRLDQRNSKLFSAGIWRRTSWSTHHRWWREKRSRAVSWSSDPREPSSLARWSSRCPTSPPWEARRGRSWSWGRTTARTGRSTLLRQLRKRSRRFYKTASMKEVSIWMRQYFQFFLLPCISRNFLGNEYETIKNLNSLNAPLSQRQPS